MFINQQNNDVYCAYLKGGTWLSAVDVVFHISTNGMTGWGTEQAYSEDTAADLRIVCAGRTVGDNGGRYQPAWFDTTLNDIFINENNDVEIAAVAGITVGEQMAARMMGEPLVPSRRPEVVAY